MVHLNHVTINTQPFKFLELSTSEFDILEPFLSERITLNIEARNCVEDIFLAFSSSPEALQALTANNAVLFYRKFTVKSLYSMNTKLECIYTSFKMPEICFNTDPLKVHIIENFDTYIQILQNRGLEERIARYFVGAMMSSNLPLTCVEQLAERLHVVDIAMIQHVYNKNIVKDGESPIRILNGISERQQQKNLNIKRPKTTSGNVKNNHDNSSLKLFYSLDTVETNKFYLHANNFKFFYYINDANKLFLFLSNSKQYIQAFQFCTELQTFIIITRDKKIENNCKKKFQLDGGELSRMSVAFSFQDLKLFNVTCRDFDHDQWYLPYNENHFLDLHKFAIKTITMQIKPKYYEFRFYCKKQQLQQIISSPAYKYFFIYEEHTNYDILQEEDVVWYNVSFFIYYLDINGFIDNALLPIFKEHESTRMISTAMGVVQLGLLYTTYTKSITTAELKADNAKRFLYMKQANSMHPYPDSQENVELMNSIKVKIRISEITNSKIEGSKHIHDGAMGAILSERGLYISSEKKTHNKWFKHEDPRSCIFFNEPLLQNCQNPKLPIKFSTS